MRTQTGVVAALLTAGALVAGCAGAPTTAPPTAGTTSPSPTGTTGPTAAVEPAMPTAPGLTDATERPQDVLTDLTTPWGLAFLPTGAVLATLRDPAQVVVLIDTGASTLDGPGADALADTTATEGEGGLLGIAVSPDYATDALVYLYRTTADGNEVVRAELTGPSPELGELQLVLTGIPAARNHNGGRIAFGPDGMLYVATGDAGDPALSEDPDSTAGAILRLTPDGEPAPGNPVPGSPIWSTGHRNVQGLGWAEDGTMYASELGASDADELNLIEPGSDYGWPRVEGTGGVDGLVDPLVVWPPSEASPSGLTVTDDAVVIAALRGQRLLVVPLTGGTVGEPDALLVGELGRLRDVVLGPDGALWVLTQNTDGRGSPAVGDDRLVRLLPP